MSANNRGELQSFKGGEAFFRKKSDLFLFFFVFTFNSGIFMALMMVKTVAFIGVLSLFYVLDDIGVF